MLEEVEGSECSTNATRPEPDDTDRSIWPTPHIICHHERLTNGCFGLREIHISRS
jgi:hypothetical protein